VQWHERHVQVVAELRRRHKEKETVKQDEAEKEAAKVERKMESVSKFFCAVPPDEVTKAWLKLVIKKALPLDLFDDPDFRQAVLATARCGKLLCTSPNKPAFPQLM